ncbi:hypothetical protein BB560_001132 [Smittium megazygosporum]|uniref:U three protein 23 n=1 Tax=Smittium megazygosporum TaxID=133381 RepID=A0A2T9ZIH7_9FUNG|nr:hypothetical protein BB560_001132 [Smittium megazygosporum]
MRAKRAKQYQKCMSVYVNSFKFREPFQVLVNSDIIKSSLDAKLPLLEQIKKAIGNSKMLISNCSLQDLRNGGDETIGALVMARKFERRRCKHSTPISTNQNTNNYIVAAQDQGLRSRLRKIPGVPLIHINNSTLILEPINTATKEYVANLETEKLGISQSELSRIRSMAPNSNSGNFLKIKRRKIKKAKGPNPLSVKKPKKAKTTSKNSQNQQNPTHITGKDSASTTSSGPKTDTSTKINQNGKRSIDSVG